MVSVKVLAVYARLDRDPYVKSISQGQFLGGLRGWSPLVKIIDHFEGLSPTKNSCIALAFQSLLTLLPKDFLLL